MRSMEAYVKPPVHSSESGVVVYLVHWAREVRTGPTHEEIYETFDEARERRESLMRSDRVQLAEIYSLEKLA